MSISKQAIVFSLFLSFIFCRQTELREGSPSDPIRDLRGLLGPSAFSVLSFGSDSVATGPPLHMRVSDGSLFFIAAYDFASIYESTDGVTFSKKIFNLPNCTTVRADSFAVCRIIGISKHNGVYQAIGVKQTGSSKPSRSVSSSIFYYAKGSSLDNLAFSEITDSNLSSTEVLFSGVESASNSLGFALYLKFNDSLGKICGLGSNANSWQCITNPSGNIYEGFVANLNGTLTYDRYYRWNGAAFTDTTVARPGNSSSAFYSSGRTLIATNTNITFTNTDPGAWTNPITTTLSTISGGISNGSYFFLGNLGGSLRAVGEVYDSNTKTTTLYHFSSPDNGASWSNLGAISIPNSGIVNDVGLSQPVIFLGNFYIRIQGRDSSNVFTVKYYKSQNMSNWTEFTP
jgi:hypothetical protein